MELREKAEQVVALLDACYPQQVHCYLHYTAPHELLFATILSAQCTDDRVNQVTAGLFVKYPSLEAFAGASLAELEGDVYATGFYHSKARNILLSAQRLLAEHGGQVPKDMDALVRLPGVGRKTANVVRGRIFQIPSIVVDTHVKRVSKRLGLTAQDNPDKVELDLMALLPQACWIRYNTQVIAHGRAVCRARVPDCGGCQFAGLCDAASVKPAAQA
jgi:endonuclease-3